MSDKSPPGEGHNVATLESARTLEFQVALVRSILILGLVAGPPLAILHWRTNAIEASINIAFSVCCLGLLFYLKRSRNIKIVGAMALAASYASFTLGYLIAPLDITRVSLYFPLVVAAFFLKGERKGTAWLCLILLTIVLAPVVPGLHVGYSIFDVARVSVYLLALFLIIRYYERARMAGEKSEIDVMAFQLSEERLRALYSHQYGFMLVVSDTGVVQSASDSVAGVLGFAPDELVGTSFFDLVHPEDLAAIATAFSEVAAQSNHVSYADLRMRCKNGAYRAIEGNGVNLLELPLIRGIVLNGHDISQRKQREDELRHQAQTDALTGLHNRRRFYELAELELARSKRYGRPLAVLMIDIDHFKSVNDTFGHHVGDITLQNLSEVSAKVLRGIDIIGRVGGEEFSAVLPETERPQALEAAERLRLALAEAAVQVPGASALRYTVSIGVTTLAPGDVTFDAIMARADAALYVAKESGRNRTCTDEDVSRNKVIRAA